MSGVKMTIVDERARERKPLEGTKQSSKVVYDFRTRLTVDGLAIIVQEIDRAGFEGKFNINSDVADTGFPSLNGSVCYNKHEEFISGNIYDLLLDGGPESSTLTISQGSQKVLPVADGEALELYNIVASYIGYCQTDE